MKGKIIKLYERCCLYLDHQNLVPFMVSFFSAKCTSHEIANCQILSQISKYLHHQVGDGIPKESRHGFCYRNPSAFTSERFRMTNINVDAIAQERSKLINRDKNALAWRISYSGDYFTSRKSQSAITLLATYTDIDHCLKNQICSKKGKFFPLRWIFFSKGA